MSLMLTSKSSTYSYSFSIYASENKSAHKASKEISEPSLTWSPGCFNLQDGGNVHIFSSRPLLIGKRCTLLLSEEASLTQEDSQRQMPDSEWDLVNNAYKMDLVLRLHNTPRGMDSLLKVVC